MYFRVTFKELISLGSENSSDPEATFRYKAGEKHLGYVGNIVESVGEKGSLVTDYAYEKNTYADSQFMKDYLEQQEAFDDGAILVTDGAYCTFSKRCRGDPLTTSEKI